jgi:hypothetical protein
MELLNLQDLTISSTKTIETVTKPNLDDSDWVENASNMFKKLKINDTNVSPELQEVIRLLNSGAKINVTKVPNRKVYHTDEILSKGQLRWQKIFKAREKLLNKHRYAPHKKSKKSNKKVKEIKPIEPKYIRYNKYQKEHEDTEYTDDTNCYDDQDNFEKEFEQQYQERLLKDLEG